MRIRFTMDDTTSPFHGLDLPLRTSGDLSLTETEEVLSALGWRLSEFRDHRNRIVIEGAQRQAIKQGASIEHPVEVSAEDDIVEEKLLLFATLRCAGYRVTWDEVGRFKARETRLVVEAQERALLAPSAVADAGAEVAEADPTEASTDSVQGVDAT
jgi:hypothetical protein